MLHLEKNSKHIPDIDIDVADRNQILDKIDFIQASKVENKKITPHNVGIYFQDIPTDPITNLSSIDYKEAEERNYIKIDILNLDIYNKIGSNKLIDELIAMEPCWELFEYEEIVNQLFHLSNHFSIIQKIKPKSLDDIAIAIALKMPGKIYLINEDKETIKENIWKKENGVYFKKSHSYAYAQVVWIQLNLLFLQNQ